MIRYIPIQLIEHVLKENQKNEFRTFLYLKNISTTGVIKRKETALDIIKGLDISKKTFNRHLNVLKEKRFLSIDSRDNIFLRSWQSIALKTNLHFTAKVEFHIKDLDKEKYKGFLMGAIISYYYKLKVFLKRKELKKGGSRQLSERMQPLSLSYLSKTLQIPQTSIVRLKNEAIKNKYVYRKKDIQTTDIDIKNINIKNLRRNWNVENTGFPIIHREKIKIVNPDLFIGHLVIKRFRNRKRQNRTQ